jgi:hypothetical protein
MIFNSFTSSRTDFKISDYTLPQNSYIWSKKLSLEAKGLLSLLYKLCDTYGDSVSERSYTFDDLTQYTFKSLKQACQALFHLCWIYQYWTNQRWKLRCK